MFIEAIAINMLLSAGLLMLILHLDRYEREPIHRVILLLAASVAATTLLGIAKHQIWGEAETSPLVSAYLRAGLPEELLKFLLFLGVAAWWRSYDESFDAIVYLSIIATGFAFNENIAYYMHATSTGALAAQESGDSGLYYRQLANIFAVRLVPSHLLVDISAGFFVGLGKVRGKPRRYFLLGLVIAVALHGTWNYLGSAGMLAWFVFFEFVLSIFVCCAIFLSLRQSRYRNKQAELALLVEKNTYLLRHGTSVDSGAELGAQLDRLSGLLDNCHFMTGEEQDAIFELVERELPHPITEHLERDGASSVAERLALLLERLAASKRARFDWRYSLGVFLILVATATVAYLLSVLGGDLLHRAI